MIAHGKGGDNRAQDRGKIRTAGDKIGGKWVRVKWGWGISGTRMGGNNQITIGETKIFCRLKKYDKM